MSKVFEDQVPNWPPGAGRFGYHAFTHGSLIDQLVRRVDPKHRSLGQYFQEELMKPHGAEECYIGLPVHLEHRMTRMSDEPLPRDPLALLRLLWKLIQNMKMLTADQTLSNRVFSNPGSLLGTVSVFFTNNVQPGHNGFNSPDSRIGVEIPSANGACTARGLAQTLNAAVTGKLLSPELMQRLVEPVVTGHDEVIGSFVPDTVVYSRGLMMNRTPKVRRRMK